MSSHVSYYSIVVCILKEQPYQCGFVCVSLVAEQGLWTETSNSFHGKFCHE